MIDLLTRVRDIGLYHRMMKSAKELACVPFENHFEIDEEGKPKCAETYNRLGRKSTADILCFIEDDVEFKQRNWDVHIEEIFAEYKPDILGVIGSTEYEGGKYFDMGYQYGVGMIEGNPGIRILSVMSRYTPCKVIDGMFMCVSKDFFEREQFDETFHGLFYYDIDLCLRTSKVGVTSLLVKHSKPPELYGVYPHDMEPVEVFTPDFEKKWNFSSNPVKNQQCCMVSNETFKKYGQTECLNRYREKYKVYA
jgi:hypothetical protein